MSPLLSQSNAFEGPVHPLGSPRGTGSSRVIFNFLSIRVQSFIFCNQNDPFMSQKKMTRGRSDLQRKQRGDLLRSAAMNRDVLGKAPFHRIAAVLAKCHSLQG
jgi:hypothetical protein